MKHMRLTFIDPRLRMTVPGRMFVRIASYSGIAVGAVAGAVFLLSDIPQLFYLGILTALFFGDQIFHIGEGDKSLHALRADEDDEINIALYITPPTYRVLEYAHDAAIVAHGDASLFILKRLADTRDVRSALQRIGVDEVQFRAKVTAILAEHTAKQLSRGDARRTAQEAITAITKTAFLHAAHDGDEFITPTHLFSALPAAEDSDVRHVFALFDISPEDIRFALLFSRFTRRQWLWRRRLPAVGSILRRSRTSHRIMNRAWTARPTPTLDRFSTDFTNYARHGDGGMLIGHDGEYDRLTDILSRSGPPAGGASAILIGDPGIGKDAIVSHLAREIVRDAAPPELFDKRIVLLHIGSVTAGASAEKLRERMEVIMNEIMRAGNVILYIPEIHVFAKTAGIAEMTLADSIIPAVTDGRISVIGTSYPKEARALIQSRTDFAQAFELVRVEEISEEDALRVLVYQGIAFERKYRITIQLEAIREAVRLARRYMRQRPLPSSAISLLTEALSDAAEKKQRLLTADDIIAIAERQTNIPLHDVRKTEAHELLNLEERIHRDFIDQEYAVKAVSGALREYRSGLHESRGPIAVFLFVGPTGVGKTELAKILADVQFGSRDAMVRFDMSEYQTAESISRFTGSSDGSVGGSLTESVLERPYTLVLLDEFEKAHSTVHNLFLQVFDDGRLTDGLGRTVDFSNTIIVATSNALSEEIIEHLREGKQMEDIAGDIKKQLTRVFRPELVNRFSDIIVFSSLSEEDIRAIAGLHLAKLERFLEEKQGIRASFTDDAVRAIARLGYSATFGARPLKQAISEYIRSQFADLILRKKLVRGGRVIVSFDGNEFVFSVLH